MIVYHNTFITEKFNKASIISSIRNKLRELEGTIDIDDFDPNLVADLDRLPGFSGQDEHTVSPFLSPPARERGWWRAAAGS